MLPPDCRLSSLVLCVGGFTSPRTAESSELGYGREERQGDYAVAMVAKATSLAAAALWLLSIFVPLECKLLVGLHCRVVRLSAGLTTAVLVVVEVGIEAFNVPP